MSYTYIKEIQWRVTVRRDRRGVFERHQSNYYVLAPTAEEAFRIVREHEPEGDVMNVAHDGERETLVDFNITTAVKE